MGPRLLFVLAAAYHLAFAAWTGLWPDRIFAVFGVPPWPASLTRLVAASVAVLGVAYLYAAKRPQRAHLIAAVGLLAKIPPPIAWGIAVAAGAWPPRTFAIVLLDDLVWWIPFALYLRRARTVA